MLCKKCGASVPDNTYECPYCKAKLGEEPVIEEEIITEEPEEETEADTEEIFDENELNRREQVKRMMEEKQQQLSEIQDRRESKRKKQQRNKIIIVAVICALVSIAVGSGAYFISNNVNKRPNVTISTPSPEPTEDPALAAAETVAPEESLVPEESVSPSPEAGQAWQASDDNTSASSTSSTSQSGASTSASTSSASGSTSSTAKSSSAKSSSAKSSSSTTKSSTSKSTSSSGKTSSSTASGSSSKTVNTGVTTKNISSMIAKGSAVVYDSNSGKYVMSFVSDGTEYYAYVSEGSTTAQVKNKTIKVSAVPSANTYKGSTVYEISNLTYFAGDSIIADSSTRLLTESDIAGLTKEQLGYARNEIFARHGRPFKTQKYKEYFAKCAWYKVDSNYNLDDDKSNLNSIERKNVDFILMHENK